MFSNTLTNSFYVSSMSSKQKLQWGTVFIMQNIFYVRIIWSSEMWNTLRSLWKRDMHTWSSTCPYKENWWQQEKIGITKYCLNKKKTRKLTSCKKRGACVVLSSSHNHFNVFIKVTMKLSITPKCNPMKRYNGNINTEKNRQYTNITETYK